MLSSSFVSSTRASAKATFSFGSDTCGQVDSGKDGGVGVEIHKFMVASGIQAKGKGTSCTNLEPQTYMCVYGYGTNWALPSVFRSNLLKKRLSMTQNDLLSGPGNRNSQIPAE